MKAIRIHKTGGPEVLDYDEMELPPPGDHEVTIKHEAIGVNFVDTYYRSGLYPMKLPGSIGSEGAGFVEAVGKNVSHLKVGDRVAYATGPVGAYSDKRNLPAKFAVKLPDEVSFTDAASMTLRGLTVHYLFKSIFPLKKGDQCLFPAAAGGLGLIACQWARSLGAQLIGTVTTEAKAQIAKDHGAWEVIVSSTENVEQRVLELSHGQKLPVVFDGVGKATWESSLNCLRSKGLMVSFGNASGPVENVNLSILAQKGSLFVTRPILAHYMDTPEKLNSAAAEFFQLAASKEIRATNVTTFKLSDARKAHETLYSKERVGSIILIP